MQKSTNNSLKQLVISAKAEMQAGDLGKAKSIFNSVLELDDKNVEAHRALARIATSESRPEDAIGSWLEVKLLRPDIKETALRLGRLYLQTKQHQEALEAFEDYLLIEPEHSESRKSVVHITNLIKHMEADNNAGKIQHLAIAGVSYCGSTVLARILGGLDDVENIGESHWLTHKKDTGSGSDVDFLVDSDSDIVHCFSCGSDCEVFTRNFRQELQQDPVNWYFKIGERLGCRTLVSADKNYSKLVNLDPGLRMDAIVLFKSPLQAWYSNYRKIAKASNSMSPITDINKYLNVWVTSYTKFLDEFENRGDKIFLNFDAFCNEPATHLETLCKLLQINNDTNSLKTVSAGQHCFGGNSGVNQNLRDKDYSFEIRKPPVLDLPKEHIALIEQNEAVQELYRRMMDLYRRDFGIIDPVIEESIESVLQQIATSQTVVDSKNKAFRQAAEDQERNLKTRLRKLVASRKGGQQIALSQKLMELIDWPAYRQLQKTYLQSDSVKFHFGFVKYLALDYWFNAKYAIANKIGLAESPSLDVLDIGAGPGHFPLVCTLMGHNVVCTDIDVSETGQWQGPHLYDALIEFFSLDRRINRINAFEPMPNLGQKFDLVTGLMIKFNVDSNGKPWGVKQWEYFLNDIANNQLNDNGRLYLKMNMTARDTSVKYIDDDVLAYLEQRGATIDLRDSTVDFRSLSASSIAEHTNAA